MTQVIDLVAARKERKPEPPKNRIALPRLSSKAAKRMAKAEAVRMAARLAI